MLFKICTVHIQPRKCVLDHAGYTAPIGNMRQIIQNRNAAALKDLDNAVEIDDMSKV